MSVSLSAKPVSKGQGGALHGSKERSPRLENSRDMPGHSNGAGRIKQRVLNHVNHLIHVDHVIKADTLRLARRISRSTFLSTVRA